LRLPYLRDVPSNGGAATKKATREEHGPVVVGKQHIVLERLRRDSTAAAFID
jgi:hypothetical protein